MEIKFDAETAATIASAAIFDSLMIEQRDGLIKQAIEHLLAPTKSPHYPYEVISPLKQAFEQAIRDAAFKAVKELIENDLEVQENIRTLLGPLLVAGLEGEAREHGNSLADTLGHALGVWLSEMARKNVS